MYLVAAILLCVALGARAFAQSQQPPEPPEDPPTASSPPPETRRIGLGEAAVLGVIEGLTEYLPVSSTGHLILASHYMGHTHFTDERGPFGPKLAEAESTGAFEIVIQLGAILAVVGLYRKRVVQMAKGVVGRDRAGLHLFLALLIAVLPAVVLGVAFRSFIKENLFSPITVCWALAVGGLAMIAVEQLYRRSKRTDRTTSVMDVTYRQALVIGVAQCLAMWPGTSRSMITIVAALLVGLDMVTAAEFSFLLALPTLGGATLYEGVKSWDTLMDSAGPAGLIVGLVVSGIVAAIAVAAFVRWLTKHGLTPFGVYRILLAAAVYAYFFL